MFSSLRQRFATFDPGLLVALLLATFAAWPFFAHASLPIATDAEMHVLRTIEIISAWQHGTPYIRWAPDLFYAFGYPVFNYYSPLTYYLGAAFGWLCCGPLYGAVAGVKFVLVSSAYLGALGMYLFVRDRWGSLAGVVSAAVFVLTPYVVYIDPHARGDVPETFAIALMPLILWAFARLRRTASPGDVVIAALLLAAEILSHNLVSLIFFGLLLAWLAWDVLFGQMFLRAWVVNEDAPSYAARRGASLVLFVAVTLALGLAAFMWMPAVLEREAIQFRNVAGGTYFDFRRYFVGLTELFAPALPFDWGATQMRFNYSVGVAQWVLGGLGLLSVFSVRLRRLSVLFFAFAGLGLLYLMLPASRQVWEAISPMAFFQFPTRFLGPTAVVLGVLAGASVGWADYLPWRNGRLFFALGAVTLCLTTALPLLYPPPWGDFGPAPVTRIIETELNGRGIGTTSANDFLPIAVQSVPGPAESLIQSYRAGVVDKVNRATLPAGTQVTVVEHSPERERFHVTGDTRFVFRLFTFYFPGWTVYVDGVPTEIMIADPDGLITFWVPEGEHEVVVQLENTPIRWLGIALSGLATITLVVLAVWRIRLPIIRPTVEALTPQRAYLLAGLILLAMGVRVVTADSGLFYQHSDGNWVVVAEREQFTPLEGYVAFLGYDLPVKEAHPGDSVPMTLYWKAQAPPQLNLRVFIHFIGPDGQLWGQSDKWNPADFPMMGWPLDKYVRDEHEVTLRADAPPGEYQILVGLWDGDANLRMHLLDTTGQPTAVDSVKIDHGLEVRP